MDCNGSHMLCIAECVLNGGGLCTYLRTHSDHR